MQLTFSSQEKKKRFIFYSSLVGVLFFISWGVFLEYCRIYRPTSPDETVGMVYEKNFHGKIVYLDKIDEFLVYGLPVAGFLVLAALFSVSRYSLVKPVNKALGGSS